MRVSTKFLKRPLFWGVAGACIIILGMIVFWLSRGDWLYPEQTTSSQTLDANLNEVTVGQTFVARQAGLQAVEIKLDIPADQANLVTLQLREHVGSTEDDTNNLVSVSGTSAEGGWVRFPFDPLLDSRSHYFYFFVNSEEIGSSPVQIHYGPPGAYFDGAMYQNGEPQEGQLAFRLSYNRSAMLLDLIKGAISASVRSVVALLVFTVPGWAFLVLFQIKRKRPFTQHWLERWSVAIGLSLAAYIILYLWANLINFRPGASLVWVVVGLSTVFLIWYYQLWQLRPHNFRSGLKTWTASRTIWADCATIFILLVAAAGRFLMIRGLAMPFWGDSVQHATITQRIIENGGLFQSWLPYSPHTTFSFHFGFHINTAVFAWVTGLDTPAALLWGGQLFNLFAVFTLYALAYRLKGAWAGAITVLAAGVLSQFPLFYVNWGRYPQLMGQAILPIAAWWTWVTLEDEDATFKNIFWLAGGASLIVGTALSYYRMAFHYLAFAGAAILIYVQSVRYLLNWRKWLTLAGAAAISLVMIFPWLLLMAQRSLIPAVAAILPQQSTGLLSVQSFTLTKQMLSVAALLNFDAWWGPIKAANVGWTGPQMLILLMGIMAIVWWGRKMAVPTVWLILVMCLPMFARLPLPGASIINQFTVTTSLYMPIALIWGVFIGSIITTERNVRWQALFLLVVTLLAVVQLPAMLQRLDQRHDLSARPDLYAATWINDNLPEDAFFLVNGFAYNKTPAGSDAGWWLPILTKRQTTIPPQYASFIEDSAIPGYREITTQLAEHFYEYSPASPEGMAAICDFPYPITHVYIGQKRGTAHFQSLERPLLEPHVFLESDLFDLVYNQDHVMIFEIDRTVCGHE